jgi:hypothetical protein
MEMYLSVLINFSTLPLNVISFQKPSGVAGTSCINEVTYLIFRLLIRLLETCKYPQYFMQYH